MPDLFYRAVVKRKDPGHPKAVVIRFPEDGSTFWLPVDEVGISTLWRFLAAAQMFPATVQQHQDAADKDTCQRSHLSTCNHAAQLPCRRVRSCWATGPVLLLAAPAAHLPAASRPPSLVAQMASGVRHCVIIACLAACRCGASSQTWRLGVDWVRSRSPVSVAPHTQQRF